jgi:membrane-bound serine protease (ClpP class)
VPARPGLPALLLLAFLLILLPATVSTAEASPTAEIVEVRGAIDDRTADFVIEAIEGAGDDVVVVVLQIDSPGVIASAETFQRLLGVVSDPPVPLVAWVGPAPAVAFGGAAQLVAAAPVRAAAPGTEIGYALPTLAGKEPGVLLAPVPEVAVAGTVTVEEGRAVAGLVDETHAAPRQLLQALDGREVGVGGDLRTLSTVTGVSTDGEEGVTVIPTVIREPGLWTRFLRLAAEPEAAFFFLVAGLSVAAFEYFAIGPGIAAAVAAVSLVLSGYGLAVLPVRWWAVGVTLTAMLLLSAAHQRGGAAAITAAGLAALVPAGVWFTDAAPQIRPALPGVLLTVAAAAFFFVLALPTVGRSRFSTQTIGRDHLIGRRGQALTDLTPDGEVEVDGARWRATSHREAGIRAGDPVSVQGIDGWYLEVDRA